MKATIIILISALILVTGCSKKDKVKKETLWGAYQEPIEAKKLPNDTGVNELQTLWQKDIGGEESIGFAILKPAVFDGQVYVASRNGKVLKVDSTSGVTQWLQNLQTPIYSAIGIGENLAVVTHDNGNVTALNINDGSLRWSISIKRQLSAVPSVGKGRVIIRTVGGLIIGLNAENGKIEWQIKKNTPGLSMHGDSTPVITGDAVLIGLASGKLIANNVINGRDYWETEISFTRGQDELERMSDSDTSPIVRGTTVYTATYQGNVAAIQLQNAAVIWRTKASTRLPMAVSGNNIIVTGDLGQVFALDTDNGEQVWEQLAFRGHGISHPVAIGNRIVIGDSNGNIHTLDATTGILVETKRVVSGAVVGIIEENSRFTVFSSRGNVSNLTISSGIGDQG